MQRSSIVCPQCKNCIIDKNPFEGYTIPICESYDCLTCPQCVIDKKHEEPKKGLFCKTYKWNLDLLMLVDAIVPCNR